MPELPDLSALTLAKLYAWDAALRAAIAASEAGGGGWASSPMRTACRSSCSFPSQRSDAVSAFRLILGLPGLIAAVVVIAWWRLALRHARGEETLAEAALGAGLIFLITWLALLYTGDA